jgi:hypothetical protein
MKQGTYHKMVSQKISSGKGANASGSSDRMGRRDKKYVNYGNMV